MLCKVSKVKPSISTHSKPCTMPRMRLLKCFVLQHSVIKTKHLRSLVRGVLQGFEWLEILGFFVTNSVHHLPIIMELSWYALPSSWMKGQKSTMQVFYSFSFPHDFCTVKFSSHLSQFLLLDLLEGFLLFTYTLQTFILYKI